VAGIRTGHNIYTELQLPIVGLDHHLGSPNSLLGLDSALLVLFACPLSISMMSPSFAFPVLGDTNPNDHSTPAFMVSTTRGFLPRQEPVVELPPEFAAVESLLQRMPIKTLSGEAGLLAKFTFGDTVEKELPDLSDQIEKFRNDLVVMNALYRDYSFIASAYLLEPCHKRYLRGEPYGLGRQVLPRSISLPIVKIAAM
jgi:hypothetical protein